MSRWAWIFCAIALLALSCDRSSEGGSVDATASSAESESAPAETGAEGESGDESSDDWSDRVQDEFRSGERRQREGASDGEPCEFFPDSCGEGESCFSSADGTRRCRPPDSGAEPGDSCDASNDCAAGQQCVGGPPGRCREMCNPDDLGERGCSGEAVCTRVRGETGDLFAWGVCRERRDTCEPWPDDDCSGSKACVRTKIGYRCLEVRSGARVGDSCSEPRDCRSDQICVSVPGGDRQCRRKCDAVHPCDQGRCADVTDRPFGYCTK